MTVCCVTAWSHLGPVCQWGNPRPSHRVSSLLSVLGLEAKAKRRFHNHVEGPYYDLLLVDTFKTLLRHYAKQMLTHELGTDDIDAKIIRDGWVGWLA